MRSAFSDFMENMKIMVVDDDPKLSGLVRVILERVGKYEVREENRSFAAVATAREFRPQLVILDIDMPGKDGGEVARELREDPSFQKLPVIFLSSMVTPQDSGERGGRHFLSKPVIPAALLKTVRAILSEGAVQRAA